MLGFGDYVMDDIASAIKSRDYKDVTDLILVERDAWSMTTEMTPKTAFELAPSLRSRDYKDPPVVAYEVGNGTGSDI